jgi:integrase
MLLRWRIPPLGGESSTCRRGQVLWFGLDGFVVPFGYVGAPGGSGALGIVAMPARARLIGMRGRARASAGVPRAESAPGPGGAGRLSPRLRPGWPDPDEPRRGDAPLRPARQAARLHARLHDLRHYAATQLIASGVDVRTVSGRIGHAGGGATTLWVYTHFQAAADRRAAQLLEQTLKRPS